MDDTRSPPPRRRESSRSRSRDRDERPRRSNREGDQYDSEPRTGERQHRRRTPSRSRSRSRSPGRQASAYRHRDTSMPPAAALPPRSQGGPFNAPAEEAAEFATRSVREHRVYVGNLSYEVRYKDLEQFMTDAGLEVAFTEILLTPNGMSKGCGIVEFTTKEDATRAITEFADKALLGRPIFIREDREEQARFGAPPSAGRMGAAGFGGAPGFGGGMGGAPGGGGRQVYVGNLPFQANWQDLKDLFRPAGAIIRADIQMGPDGRPKGSGTVVYETVEDAQNAIAQFNGFDWFGRRLEVREDRFAFAPRGGFRGGMGMGFRGGMMGGFGGRGGFQGRGGFGGAPGGFGGGFGGGFQGGAPGGYQGGAGGFGGAPAYGQQSALGGGDAFGHAGGAASYNPSKQILVNNLPWSTSNEDLVELFETTGEVVAAEILLDMNTGRSRGQGIVEFTAADQSTTAIAKFTGYMYGGRPLEVRYNARFHQFTPSAGKGGAPAEV